MPLSPWLDWMPASPWLNGRLVGPDPSASQLTESKPGAGVSHPACGSWTTCGSGPGHECMHVVTGWGLLGPCPPGNEGRSPPHKESSPKAIWDDPYVSPPMTVSMENGVGPAPGSPEKQPGSPSPPSVPETGQGATKGEGGTPAPASLPGGSKEEEEKAKRLLYCALCKVAVNSLSQLEAHNKGKTPSPPPPTPHHPHHPPPPRPARPCPQPATAPYLPAPQFPLRLTSLSPSLSISLIP